MLPSSWARSKGNFPPKQSGKYHVSQANEFSTYIVFEKLASYDLEFFRSFVHRVEQLNTDVFKSVKIRGLVAFQKYYLKGREPSPRSDLGDFLHLSPIPYCKIAVMERDQCATVLVT